MFDRGNMWPIRGIKSHVGLVFGKLEKEKSQPIERLKIATNRTTNL